MFVTTAFAVVVDDVEADATSPWEGEGTEGSPYLIKSVDDLEALATNVNNETYKGTGFFKLTADLDLTGKEWTPIGHYNSNLFKGKFNGNSHMITGLTIMSGDCGGLFGGIGEGAVVKNLGLVNTNITCSPSDGGSIIVAGGIVGYNNGGTIQNCYNTGIGTITVSGTPIENESVDSKNSAGGIAGYNGGIIQNCYNTINITATGNLKTNLEGGITGIIKQGIVRNCYNTGNMSASGEGGNAAGGIIGMIDGSATVQNCYWLNSDNKNIECIGNDTDPTMATKCNFFSTKTLGDFTLDGNISGSPTGSLKNALNEYVTTDGTTELKAWKIDPSTYGPYLEGMKPIIPEVPPTPEDPSSYNVTFPSGEGYSVRYNSTTISNELPFSIFVEEGYTLGNVTASNGEVQYMGGGSYVLKNVTSDSQVYVNVMKTTSNIDNSGTETVLVAVAALAVVVLSILAYALIKK